MMRAARLAAMIVPVLGLAGVWATSERTYHQGTEWEVPIAGYDPRDYLRGHYVEFTYDWPEIAEFRGVPPAMLCIEGTAPVIARVVEGPESGACANPLRPDRNGVYGWDGLTRGRLYVGQDRAAQLDRQLRNRDQRGIVTIRQREDGSFTPIAIRFRPLTPAEIAERDAADAGAQELPPPPAIMTR